MVISAGLFSQIKYIYIEDLRSSQISLLGGVRLRSGLEVCISHPSVLLRLSVNHALVKSKSRGKWDAGEAEKKARAIVVRSWEGFGTVGAPRSQASCSEEEPEDAEQLLQLRAPSWCPRAQGHGGGCTWVCTVHEGRGWVQKEGACCGLDGSDGGSPFLPHGHQGWLGSSGSCSTLWALGIPQLHFLWAISGDGAGEGLESSTGGGGTSPAAPLLLITRGARTSVCCILVLHAPGWPGGSSLEGGQHGRGVPSPGCPRVMPTPGAVLQGSGTARRPAARRRPRGPSATTAAVPWSPPARRSCSRSPRPAWTQATVCSLPTVKW